MPDHISKQNAKSALRGARLEVLKRGGIVHGYGVAKDGIDYCLVVYVVPEGDKEFDDHPFRSSTGVLVRPKVRDTAQFAAQQRRHG